MIEELWDKANGSSLPHRANLPVYWLLQNKPGRGEVTIKPETRRDESADFQRIRCPLCRWQPKASDRWLCGACGEPEYFFAGCGASWNTFATRGLCPGCRHLWKWTICLRCQGWSRHDDWYGKNVD